MANDLTKLVNLANQYWNDVKQNLSKNVQVTGANNLLIARKMLELAWLYVLAESQASFRGGSWDVIFDTLEAILKKPNPHILGDFSISVRFKIDNTGSENVQKFLDVYRAKYIDYVGQFENNFSATFPVLAMVEICKKGDKWILQGNNVITRSKWHNSIAAEELQTVTKMESQYGFVYTNLADIQKFNPATQYDENISCLPDIVTPDNSGGGSSSVKTDCPCKEVKKSKTLYLRRTRETQQDGELNLVVQRTKCFPQIQGKRYKFKCDISKIAKDIADIASNPISNNETGQFPTNLGRIRR